MGSGKFMGIHCAIIVFAGFSVGNKGNAHTSTVNQAVVGHNPEVLIARLQRNVQHIQGKTEMVCKPLAVVSSTPCRSPDGRNN